MSRTIALISKAGLVVAALSIAATAYAQQPPNTDERGFNCDHTFTSGAAKPANLLRWCVSNHGNLVMFESPTGQEHIRVGDFVEGYVACSGGVGLPTPHGFDIGPEESGWGPATVSGLSSDGVTITRTTTDGSIKTTSKFTRDTVNKQINLAVTVKNNTAATLFNVQYARIVDIDANGTFANDWTRTRDSVIAVENPNAGLSLGTQSFQLLHFTGVIPFGDALADCGFSGSQSTPINGDFAAKIVHVLGDLAAGASKTVKLVYKRQ